MEKNIRTYILIFWGIFGLTWVYFNRTSESLSTFIIISIIFLVIHYKQKLLKRKDSPNLDDPYKASYEVDEIHNDFTKVGSGYPIKKNQKISCCNPLMEGDTQNSCSSNCHMKKNDKKEDDIN